MKSRRAFVQLELETNLPMQTLLSTSAWKVLLGDFFTVLQVHVNVAQKSSGSRSARTTRTRKKGK